jgi:predicted Zn-dependent protease
LQRYIDEIGRKLTQSRRAGDFQYTFNVVSDDSIEAFAQPGGPMFIHTGLIKAADNEAQLAGVMSHENPACRLAPWDQPGIEGEHDSTPCPPGRAIRG